MKYYSTNHQAPEASLQEAVVKGLASDKGLYMPEVIQSLPTSFYDNIENLSFQEIAYQVADAFFGEDVPADVLKEIVYDTLSFDAPCVEVKENIYSLELFHGPTLAFKDSHLLWLGQQMLHLCLKGRGETHNHGNKCQNNFFCHVVEY